MKVMKRAIGSDKPLVAFEIDSVVILNTDRPELESILRLPQKAREEIIEALIESAIHQSNEKHPGKVEEWRRGDY